MRLTIVGSASAYARTPGRSSSCYLVEHAGEHVVLDLGQGSFAALSEYLDPAAVSAILVSHLHADHMVDLVPLRHYLRYGAAEERTVALHAPAPIRARFDALLAEAGFLAPLPGPPLEEGERRVGALRVLVRRVTHTDSSFGFRLSPDGDPDASGLVYSGDCARGEDLLPLLRAGDTLLCEAYFGVGDPVPEAMHLTAADAAAVAAAGGASRLILTHIHDGADGTAVLERARSVFAGAVELAAPGAAIDVS